MRARIIRVGQVYRDGEGDEWTVEPDGRLHAFPGSWGEPFESVEEHYGGVTLAEDSVGAEVFVGSDQSRSDTVNHPPHYTSHPSGVECIQITEHMDFLDGNVFKYMWRAGLKSDDPLEDYKKALFYLERKVKQLEAGRSNQ
jgi:hypothetical protein